MSDRDETGEVARLERLNQELSESLKRCRDLLHGYEVRLAANSNVAETPDAGEEAREGSRNRVARMDVRVHRVPPTSGRN